MLELAGRNLRQALPRNSLTTLGISVGVASLVAMLSLGIGLQQFATRQLGRSGLFESIIVSSRQDFRSEEDRRQPQPPVQSVPLDDAARRSFERIPGVAEVYPEIRAMVEAEFPSQDGVVSPKMTVLAALPMSASNSEALDDKMGSFFSGAQAAEAMLTTEFAREVLGLPEKRGDDAKLAPEQAQRLLGREITIRYAQRQQARTDVESFSIVRKEQRLKIVGIAEREPLAGFRSGPRARIFMPTALAQQLDLMQAADLRSLIRPSNGKTYGAMVVRVKKAADVKAAQEAIRKQGFSTFSMLDASKGMTRFFTVLDLFLGIFGSLALVVASLGIINTLVMTVLERRREIGVMKAIGASDVDIQQLFFLEAGVMGIAGGLGGIALGWSIGRLINAVTNVYMRSHDLTPEKFWYVPWWLIGVALAFSVIMSLVSGIYPAARAARLDPVQALRHE